MHRRRESVSGSKDKKDEKKDDKKDDKKDKDDKKKKKDDGKDKDKDKKGGKKTKAKVAFEVVVKGLDQLKPDDNGKKIQVNWKRGRKSANKGKTKPVKRKFVQSQ